MLARSRIYISVVVNSSFNLAEASNRTRPRLPERYEPPGLACFMRPGSFSLIKLLRYGCRRRAAVYSPTAHTSAVQKTVNKIQLNDARSHLTCGIF